MPFDLPFWRQWEGQLVETVFPLERCMIGDDRSAVFDTQFEGGPASIKLFPETGSGEDLQARWRKAAGLSHPSLVPILAYGKTQLGAPEDLHCAYIVTPRADENLADALAEMPLTTAQTLDSLQPVLGVLQYLEAKGLAPGGLLPSDIMAYGEQIRISSDNLVDSKGNSTLLLRSLGTLIEAMLGAAASQQPLPEPFAEVVRKCKNPDDPQDPWTLARIEARLFPPVEVTQAAAQEPEPLPPSPRPWLRWGIAAAAVFGIVAYFWPASSPKEKNDPPPSAIPSTSSSAGPAPSAATGETKKPPATETLAAKGGVNGKSKPSPTGNRAADPTPAPAADHNSPVVQSTTSLDGITQVMPEIPQQAQRTISGRVRVNVRVRVDGAGRVTEASPAPPRVSQYFTTRAITAAQAWKFPPSQGNAPQEWVLHFELTRDAIHASAGKLAP